jgi:hypothetical protein
MRKLLLPHADSAAVDAFECLAAYLVGDQDGLCVEGAGAAGTADAAGTAARSQTYTSLILEPPETVIEPRGEDEALVWVLSRTQHCEKVRGVFYINIQIINFEFMQPQFILIH